MPTPDVKLSHDDLAVLRKMARRVRDLPGPVFWSDWPTGELDYDDDEDGNEIEVELTRPVFGAVPHNGNVMLFMLDPDGDISDENRALVRVAINGLPLLVEEIDRLVARYETCECGHTLDQHSPLGCDGCSCLTFDGDAIAQQGEAT